MPTHRDSRKKPGFIAFWIIVLIFLVVFPVISFIFNYAEIPPHLHFPFIIYVVVFSLVWVAMFFVIPWAEKYIIRIVNYLKEHRKAVLVLLALLFILSLVCVIYLPYPYNLIPIVINIQLYLMLMFLLPFPYESILLIPNLIIILVFFHQSSILLTQIEFFILIITITLILITLVGAKSINRESPFREPDGALIFTIIMIFTTSVISCAFFFILTPNTYFLLFFISHIVFNFIFALFNIHRNWDVICQKILNFYHAYEKFFHVLFLILLIIFIIYLFITPFPLNIVFIVLAITFAIILSITLPFPADIIFLGSIFLFMLIAFPLITLYSLMWLWIQIPIIIKWVSGIKARKRKRRQSLN